MQSVIFEMNSNIIANAKYKLSKHKALGEKSDLSIYQVASLLDRISKNVDNDGVANPMRFFAN